MYVKHIILDNVGPIGRLGISFPGVDEEKPKPVIFVGENGSGKSILLSYIVNGLLMAQDTIYENPEVEKDRVYKLGNPQYIKVGEKYYSAKVEFEQGLGYLEWSLSLPKGEFKKTHTQEANRLASMFQQKWQATDTDDMSSLIEPELFRKNTGKGEEIFNRNCILYFPPNRFEEPAWLNQENLKAQAEFLDNKNMLGKTNRRIINYAPLRDNQNWLFGLVFDSYVHDSEQDGEATNILKAAVTIVRTITQKRGTLKLGIGKRRNRAIALNLDGRRLIPNIFQLSSGATALLNLFLSILRDFDLSKSRLTKMEEIRGIVVVDEIDLHLHSVHQYEVLPALMKMFPRVQFVVTSHSPLFVLGLQKVLGEDGFTLYEMPDGKQISPEQFREFGTAYDAFAETRQHEKILLAMIEKSQEPILIVEGQTDICYLKKAASFFQKESVLGKFQMEDGGGYSNKMKPVEKALKKAEKQSGGIFPSQKVVFLYDCEVSVGEKDSPKGKIYTKNIPLCEINPIKKGIENLFDEKAIEKARKANSNFIAIMRTQQECGGKTTQHEEWSVPDVQKTNLCNWFCEHGTADDFQNFKEIFEILEKILSDS